MALARFATRHDPPNKPAQAQPRTDQSHFATLLSGRQEPITSLSFWDALQSQLQLSHPRLPAATIALATGRLSDPTLRC